MAKSKFQDHQFAIILGITQLIFLILYGVFTEFHPDAQPRASRAVGAVTPNIKYPLVIDTHAAIFAGFGFLVVFLRRYGFGGIAINLLLGAFTVEWALLVRGFFARSFERFPIGVTEIVWADFSAAVVLISFGALVGKLTPVQYLLLALIETVVSVATEFLVLNVLRVTDIGGAIVVHLFGAFFGLAASRVLFKAQWNSSEHFGSVYHSDLFSFIGTFFLWVFWPSFNAFHATTEESRNRAILNTILGLVGSTIFAFFTSIVVNKSRRFSIKHIVNASLAGGVAIAAVADIILDPVWALVVGILAGIVSVLGFAIIGPLLHGKLNFHDSRGVLSLHGLPALIGAISGIFFVFFYKKESYGDRTTNVVFPEVAVGNREQGEQALIQLAGIGVVLLISVITGAITGFILRLPIWNQVREKEFFSDLDYFDVPEDFDFSTRVTSHIERVELTEERVRLTGE